MIGRALRQKMLADAAETPNRVALRIGHMEAIEQAVREREARYPELTPENLREATEWQESRIRELSPEWRVLRAADALLAALEES